MLEDKDGIRFLKDKVQDLCYFANSGNDRDFLLLIESFISYYNARKEYYNSQSGQNSAGL